MDVPSSTVLKDWQDMAGLCFISVCSREFTTGGGKLWQAVRTALSAWVNTMLLSCSVLKMKVYAACLKAPNSISYVDCF